MPMNVMVRTSSERRRVRLASGSTVEDALKAVELPVCKHIVIRKGVPLPSDERLLDGDSIDVVSVFSGG